MSLGEANDICESVGSRLCTEEEMMADCTRGLGCGFDTECSWTANFIST